MFPRLVALFVLSLFSSTATASADVPILGPSYATAASGHIEIAPDRSGPSLSELGLTITVVVLDVFGFPIPNFPWQDIWVSDDVGGADLRLCNGGAMASANTDVNGMTTITTAIAGGGTTDRGLQVYLAGVPLDSVVSPPLDIIVSSADLDADLDVDATDLTMVPGGFADFFLNGSYDFEADLNLDDVEDILDIVRFAELFLGQVGCP